MSPNPTLLALLALTASTLAAPTAALTKRIAPNTQACTVQDNVFFLSYSVDIGVTWANGMGCGTVLGAIQNQGVAVSNWQCVDDGAGGTQLWFNAPYLAGVGASIDTALVEMYPGVQGGFNCPDS